MSVLLGILLLFVNESTNTLIFARFPDAKRTTNPSMPSFARGLDPPRGVVRKADSSNPSLDNLKILLLVEIFNVDVGAVSIVPDIENCYSAA